MSLRVTKIGDWSLARRLLSGASRRIKGAIDKAVLQEAQFFRTKIIEGLREGAPGGQALAPLAPTTLAIRRFLHAAFRSAGLDAPAGDRPSKGIAVIKIPARPFLRPVFAKHSQPEEVSRRFLDRVAKLLGGRLRWVTGRAHGGLAGVEPRRHSYLKSRACHGHFLSVSFIPEDRYGHDGACTSSARARSRVPHA